MQKGVSCAKGIPSCAKESLSCAKRIPSCAKGIVSCAKVATQFQQGNKVGS
ncbi:hypothetical protein [Rummeliibacillus sp. POC4]|uniref:hypothetical protein n=1 Tax=Rummeliibacillus sp. POC4 TaxID=2305899 RepID=UPI001314EAF9|nr:hypothetical protein [Rummeliibacillus sp. POC4]